MSIFLFTREIFYTWILYRTKASSGVFAFRLFSFRRVILFLLRTSWMSALLITHTGLAPEISLFLAASSFYSRPPRRAQICTQVPCGIRNFSRAPFATLPTARFLVPLVSLSWLGGPWQCQMGPREPGRLHVFALV